MKRSDYLRDRRINGQRPRPQWVYALFVIPVLCVVGLGVYFIPSVRWRVDTFRTELFYRLNPPDEAVFIPQGQQDQLEFVVQSTLNALTPEATATGIAPTATLPGPTSTPGPTALPLPQSVILPGVKYEHQHGRWNYCGPANLSMSLTFWGWNGDRDVVGEYVKPSSDDKNVMPYEMADFVNTQVPGMKAFVRHGGEIEMLKAMIAGGYPVLVEKGYYEHDFTGKFAWLGHYQFVNGYNDVSGAFTLQDTYVDDGQDHQTSYQDFIDGWRSFNYLFMVVYPEAEEAEVLSLLGNWADEKWAAQNALRMAQEEGQTLTGINQFFAWFNQGTSHVNLQQYFDAAVAYDFAFSLYAALEDDDSQRPYRIMWYQTGPYWAYYYSGRYGDTINLATTTLTETISEPVLEESLYWRGLAREAIGEMDNAISDYRDSVRINPNFTPGWAQLERLGVGL
ncbi:MAG: hypothetical protein DWQ07_14840 [Chloroflexi bacterium]|nr:MAG: hypothetical protein DWQ07_14840 [Chloroflexota bacterium]MBL1195640.1 hypothetical protein [Chloroflexota bacterium]NOH12928.1 hypothetical protein [Chloroflexota bacterium]